jgi:hypothetical protein
MKQCARVRDGLGDDSHSGDLIGRKVCELRLCDKYQYASFKYATFNYASLGAGHCLIFRFGVGRHKYPNGIDPKSGAKGRMDEGKKT